MRRLLRQKALDALEPAIDVLEARADQLKLAENKIVILVVILLECCWLCEWIEILVGKRLISGLGECAGLRFVCCSYRSNVRLFSFFMEQTEKTHQKI